MPLNLHVHIISLIGKTFWKDLIGCNSIEIFSKCKCTVITAVGYCILGTNYGSLLLKSGTHR